MDEADAARERVARRREHDRRRVETQLAMVRPQRAREDLQQRRLAGAVLADDRMRLAVGDRAGDAAERRDGAERLVNLVEFDHPRYRFGGRPRGPGRHRRTLPASGWRPRASGVSAIDADVM